MASEVGTGKTDQSCREIVEDSLEETSLDLRRTPNHGDAFAVLFPAIKIVEGEPCSGCTSSLYMTLKKSRAPGLLDNIGDLTLVIGTKIDNVPSGENILCIGNCTKKLGAKHFLPICPFQYKDFFDFIERHFVQK